MATLIAVAVVAALGLLGYAGWRARGRAAPVRPAESTTSRGIRSGVDYEVRTSAPPDRRLPACTTVECRTPSAARLTIDRNRALSSPTDRDLSLGDPVFDPAVGLRGPRAEALAVLDAPSRRRVQAAVARGWRFAEGAWTFGPDELSEPEIALRVSEGVELALVTQLEPLAVPKGLLARVGDDPLPDIRLDALRELVGGYAGSPATTFAVAQVLEDPLPWVRVAGASVGQQVSQLIWWARYDAPPLAAPALDALAANHASDPLAQAFLAEPALLALLARRGDDPTRAAALRALAALGTLAAVPAILELRDLPPPSTLRGAAEAALEGIQRRHPALEGGGLALASADTQGGVSLAEEAAAPAESPDPALLPTNEVQGS